MSLLRRGLLERRGAAVLVFGLFVAAGIVFVFAGTLARATELEQQAALAREEVQLFRDLLAASDAEIRFLDDPRFLEQQARVVGWGERNEQAFELPGDAPSPEPILPLGSLDEVTRSSPPLEAWLELLFGA